MRLAAGSVKHFFLACARVQVQDPRVPQADLILARDALRLRRSICEAAGWRFRAADQAALDACEAALAGVVSEQTALEAYAEANRQGRVRAARSAARKAG